MIVATHSTAARMAVRFLAGCAMIATALSLTGCGTISVKRDLDAILDLSTVPAVVAKGEELKSAERAAAAIPGAQAFRGLGSSMMPLYASGTAIVVVPMDFAKLRRGMQVLYVNQSGFGVAHVLVGDLPDGWIAQGVGNEKEDPDLVTPANFVGVISGAFTSELTTVWSNHIDSIARSAATIRTASL